MNYYPFHIGDYASATRHLSWEEDGAYRRLLDVYYTTEKPLPLESRACCRLVLATTEAQREAVATVLAEFFKETPDGWINTRADEEIAAMRVKQQSQRDKANKRWHKPEQEPGNAPAQTNDATAYATAHSSDAIAMPPTPTPTPTPKKENAPKVADIRFEKFWSAYPSKVGKDAARRAFEKRKPDDETLSSMLLAIDRQRRQPKWVKDGGEFIPNPATWLNEGRWQDEAVAVVDDRFAGAL